MKYSVKLTTSFKKALHDKKEAIKERDISRQAKRESRDYRF